LGRSEGNARQQGFRNWELGIRKRDMYFALGLTWHRLYRDKFRNAGENLLGSFGNRSSGYAHFYRYIRKPL
jgi:hypothetical protein